MLEVDLHFNLTEREALSDVAAKIFCIFDQIKVVKQRKMNNLPFLTKYRIEEQNECIVCLEQKHDKKSMFNCHTYHPICDDCFHNYYEKNGENYDELIRCPECRAKLLPEFKNPKDISLWELLHINVTNIDQQNISIINISLENNLKISTVCTDNSHVTLYNKNGNLYKFEDLFVSPNGFLYHYIEFYDIYILSIKNNKFQGWKQK